MDWYRMSLVDHAVVAAPCFYHLNIQFAKLYLMKYNERIFCLQYVPENIYWCSVEKFEVSWFNRWQWITEFTEKTCFNVTGLLPNTPLKIKVRALTSKGFAPFSPVIKFSTGSGGYYIWNLFLLCMHDNFYNILLIDTVALLLIMYVDIIVIEICSHSLLYLSIIYFNDSINLKICCFLSQ